MKLEEAYGCERVARGTMVTCVARWPVSGLWDWAIHVRALPDILPPPHACPLSFAPPTYSPTNPLVQATGALPDTKPQAIAKSSLKHRRW